MTLQAKTESRKPQQLELAIEHAPPKVRRHGLRDAHTRPLVSRGKQRDGSFPGSHRVPAHEAWSFPSLELRTGNSWPCIILDCDGQEGTERLIDAIHFDRTIPEPSWSTTRLSSGGTHAVWCLVRPVHRGEQARQKPLVLFSRVVEYMAEAVGADAGYAGVLSHNPMARAHGPDLRTKWGRREPYPLKELAEIIPLGWRVPKVPLTAVGRNCTLFLALCRWAGSPANLSYDVLPAALAANQDFDYPLEYAEVAGIARSVERYRRGWIAAGRFYSDEEASAYGAEGGRRSGRARRKRTAERDAAVVEAVASGASLAAVADAYGLTDKGTRWIVERDAPLLLVRDEGLKPWQLEGISRATWYRRRNQLETNPK